MKFLGIKILTNMEYKRLIWLEERIKVLETNVCFKIGNQTYLDDMKKFNQDIWRLEDRMSFLKDLIHYYHPSEMGITCSEIVKSFEARRYPQTVIDFFLSSPKSKT